jgi:hypothetical protein
MVADNKQIYVAQVNEELVFQAGSLNDNMYLPSLQCIRYHYCA